MTAAFYRLVGKLGLLAVAFFARLVATGYFLLAWSRVRRSLRFYRALFPDLGLARALWLTLGQFHDFAQTFALRLRLSRGAPLPREHDGWQHIEAAAEAGKGGVLLMSHLGPWELGARLFRRRGMRLMLFVSARHREQIERMQKTELVSDGVELVVATPEDDSALNGLDGLRLLRDGGFVSMAGDRVHGRGARRIAVRFAGQTAMLPQAPFALALVSGSPILIVFILREGRHGLRAICRPPLYVEARDRKDREPAMARAAQRYADELCTLVRAHPTQWHCFEPFLEQDPERSERDRQRPE